MQAVKPAAVHECCTRAPLEFFLVPVLINLIEANHPCDEYAGENAQGSGVLMFYEISWQARHKFHVP